LLSLQLLFLENVVTLIAFNILPVNFLWRNLSLLALMLPI
jgi:hypothetical protein